MSFEVKRAAEKDAADFGMINALSWRAAYKGIVPDDYLAGFTPESRAERFGRGVKKGDDEFYLFLVNQKPAGMAVIGACHDDGAESGEGEIHAIYFLPEYWRQGFGKKAMRFCTDRLNKTGYKEVLLWVLEKNGNARRFYEKCGFATDGGRMSMEIGKPLSVVRYRVTL